MLHPLLAGAFTVLILAVATASSVATTIALRDWAHTSYEASLAAAGDLPLTAGRRSGPAPATR
jgi:hypothetical protein